MIGSQRSRREPTLVAATKHDVKRVFGMLPQHVCPHWIRAAKVLRFDGETEAIATVKHDVHCLADGRYPEMDRRALVYPIGNL